MKKTLLSIVVASTLFSVANDNFVLVIDEKDSNYEINNGSYRTVESAWADSGAHFNCEYNTEVDDVYSGKSYTSDGTCKQEQTRTVTIYFTPPFSEEHVHNVSTETKTIDKSVNGESLIGVHTESSCKNALSFDSSFRNQNDIYKISSNGQEVNVYCDMTADGGGWTLVGVVANDDTHHWSFDSTA